jgi:hypothetical protein
VWHYRDTVQKARRQHGDVDVRGRERGSALGEWEERGEIVTVAQRSKGKRMGPLVTAVAAQSPGEIQNVALPRPIRRTATVAEPSDLARFRRHLSFTRY